MIQTLLLLLDSPNVHRQFKKIKQRRQISTVNDVFRYSWNTDNLGCILTLQARQQGKKAPDGEVHVCCQHETRKISKFELLYSCYDDWVFDSCSVEVNTY